MNNKLYTAGEFAKLCGTTKSTLFVYDKKGLLKPAITGENGYRYYKAEQHVAFFAIKSLQFAGTSLSEISKILNINDKEKLYSTLEKNRSVLAKQQLELMQMQKHIDKLISSADAIYYADGKVHTKYYSTEYILVTPTGYKNTEGETYYYSLEALNKHWEYIESRGYSENDIENTFDIITKSDFEKRNYVASFHCTQVPYETNDKAVIEKPAGMYAVMVFNDSWENIKQNCDIFKAELEKNGLQVTGDFYIRDILFSLLFTDKNSHSYYISVKINS